MQRTIFLTMVLFAGLLSAQDPAVAGKVVFEKACAPCHGKLGMGGRAPSILARIPAFSDIELSLLAVNGVPAKGMPPVAGANGFDMSELIRYLRQMASAALKVPPRKVQMVDGTFLDGALRNEGLVDLQLLTADARIHLLRHAANGRYREVTSQVDWPSYDGQPQGNRYTTMTQIDKRTVGRLAPKWIYHIPDEGRLEVTPVVVGGIMYVTSGNDCYALDAGTGREIWHFHRPLTPGIADGPMNLNRGVGVAGNLVFKETDHAHIIALDRFTGDPLWESEIADYRENYFATSAPLVAGDLLIAGVGGGEHGANGMVVAFEQATGKEVWRFHTVPRAGEPGSETWQGKDNDHGGAPTWFIGTYDPELDTVYWPVGNPAEEYNGDARQGDNLYSDCILALDRKTGALKWHYQFTPHDLWDWDATETSVLVDADWQGKPRRLMLHADRNGFFYVFDRTDGALLLAKQFIKNLTWASVIGADGRPIKNPNQEPSAAGTRVCPSQEGATNWFSPSFNPITGLYYVQTYEKCSIYTKTGNETWTRGRPFLGGSARTAPDLAAQTILRAIDIRTGAIAWELPQPGPAESWGGTLTTASGLVLFGEESGALAAADAATGKLLWSFPTNDIWKASPMTYMFDGHQYVAAASSSNIIAFGINE